MHTAPSAKAPTDGIISHYVRWKFDPNATDPSVEPVELVNLDGEMPKVDARYETKPYQHVFLAMHDPNSLEPAIGGAYNSIAKGSVEDGTYEYWSAGNSTSLHEVAFVPRSEDGESILFLSPLSGEHQVIDCSVLTSSFFSFLPPFFPMIYSPRSQWISDLGCQPEG